MAKRGLSLSRVLRGFILPTAYWLLPTLLLAIGCSTTLNRNVAATNPPIMRVRLMMGIPQLMVAASVPPVYRTDSDPTPRVLGLPKNTPMAISLTPAGWRVGTTVLGSGVLQIQPAQEGSITVAPVLTGVPEKPVVARAYRGIYKLVPTSATTFDLVNEVDIEGYLAGVLPRELLKSWHEETYKAQAIIARTYALYEKGMYGTNRHWDVFDDEKSQVYGGMSDETDKSRAAVNATQGVVVAYAADGQTPHIFKAYFSSCCGGVSQSSSDAFKDPFSEPLQDQNNHAICNASPKFNWGPVVISKVELTRRMRAWGAYKNMPAKNMDTIKEVMLQQVNAWGRPTRFAITDAKNNSYSLQAEEFRSACNWDAKSTAVKGKPPVILYSSFVKVITDSESIRFVEGHGWGHGVGMCQWCSQRLAEDGVRHEDIVLAAYPHAKLVRAY